MAPVPSFGGEITPVPSGIKASQSDSAGLSVSPHCHPNPTFWLFDDHCQTTQLEHHYANFMIQLRGIRLF